MNWNRVQNWIMGALLGGLLVFAFGMLVRAIFFGEGARATP